MISVTSLPAKKHGHPLLLGEELEWKIQLYLRAIQESGRAVNTAIVLGAARGIKLKLNRTMLVENGGHVDLSNGWARGLPGPMGFVKRRGTTSKSNNLVEDNPGLIVNGFHKAGIQQAIDSTNETVATNDSIDETPTAW